MNIQLLITDNTARAQKNDFYIELNYLSLDALSSDIYHLKSVLSAHQVSKKLAVKNVKA